MSLNDLVREGLIKPFKASQKQAADRIRLADRDIKTARLIVAQDRDWAFSIAYNAVLQASRALMFGSGDGRKRLMTKTTTSFLSLCFLVLVAGCTATPALSQFQKADSRETFLMAPMNPVLQRQASGVETLALSPDGRSMATAGSQGVEIRDLSGKQTAAIQGMEGDVLSLQFSPEGRFLAVGGYRKVGVWDAATGERLWIREGHLEDVVALAFSLDGKTLATGSRGDDRTLRLWDVLSGEGGRSLKIDTLYADQTRALAWNPDGKRLAYAGLDGTIRVWDVETGETLTTLKEEGHLPVSLVYHPAGKFLTSGGMEGGISLWDAAAVKVVGRTRIGTDVRAMTYSRDGNGLTVVGADGIVRQVDMTSGQVQERKNLGTSPAWAVLTPGGETLLAYGEGNVSLFSLKERTGLPPVIALLLPSESQGVVKDPVLRLSAKVLDDQGIDRVTVTMNGQTVGSSPFILRPFDKLTAQDERRMKTRDLIVEGKETNLEGKEVKREWNLIEDLVLTPGDNRIAILVQDVEGLEGRKDLVVRYEEEKGEVWGAVIGISQYSHIQGLKYPDADARSFYDYLVNDNGIPEDHVTLLLNEEATLQRIKDLLGVEIKRKARKEDTVILYYAGHGAPEPDSYSPDGDGLEKYLLPYDADPQRLYTTALPMAEISRIISRFAADRVILIQDTCYSGASGGRTIQTASVRASLSDRYLDRLTQGKGRVILTASAANEVSIEKDDVRHGIFTYYLLESFRNGDLDGDGIITTGEAFRYVSRKVPDATDQNQHPVKKGEETEGEIAIGKRVGEGMP